MPRCIPFDFDFAILKKYEPDFYFDYYLMIESIIESYGEQINKDGLDELNTILKKFKKYQNNKLQRQNRLYLTYDFTKVELMVVNCHENVLNNLEDKCNLLYYTLLNNYPDMESEFPFHYPHIWIFRNNELYFHTMISANVFGELLDAFHNENLVDRTSNRSEWVTSQIPRKKHT